MFLTDSFHRSRGSRSDPENTDVIKTASLIFFNIQTLVFKLSNRMAAWAAGICSVATCWKLP